jgi:hypothetical protein
LLFLCNACSGTDESTRWAGTIETLPNGAIRVTNPPDGLWEDDNAWQLEQELVLGQTDGEGAAVFASISGLAVDGSGRIHVLDRQANELRIFDGEGTHIRTVGRAGRGPGEYSTANGLAWFSEDSLLVVDQEGNRYSILDRRGDYIRSVRRRLSFFGWVFRGGIDGGRIYELSSVGADEDRLALLGTRLTGDSLETSMAVTAADDGTDGRPGFGVDTLLLARPDGPLYEAFSIRTERGGMVIGVPFAGAPQYYLDGNGGVWHGHGGTPRLYHSTFPGDTLTEIILQTEAATVTPEEIEEWEAQPALERFRTLGGKLDISRIPAMKPYFDGITIDPEGYIWLTVPGAPQRAVFAVLDPDGRYLGQLQLPGVARDAYVPTITRNDRLYFVGSDELDVQRVYVYRIGKSRTRTAQTTGG